MKTLPALKAVILIGLGGICNDTRTTFEAQSTLTPNEQSLEHSSEQYLRDLQNELSTIKSLNAKNKLSPQNIFFVMYFTQKVAELEVLITKHKASLKSSCSHQIIPKLKIAIQLKIDEIELLKTQAHLNINDTNIIGL